MNIPATIDNGENVPRAIEHMRVNCARDIPWLVGGAAHDGVLVICGGAPSLKHKLFEIMTLQQNGAVVIACNGANNFMRVNSVTPDVVVLVDPGEAVGGFISQREKDDATHLVASICHPSVFDKLAAMGKSVEMWHPDIPGAQNAMQKEILAAYPDKPAVLIGGGMSGAMRSLNLGYALGFRKLRLYGVDSSYAEGGPDHAYAKHDGPEPESMHVAFNGKGYTCSPWMVRQADEFRFYYRQFTNAKCRVTVHGEGLLPDIARHLAAIMMGEGLRFTMPSTIAR